MSKPRFSTLSLISCALAVLPGCSDPATVVRRGKAATAFVVSETRPGQFVTGSAFCIDRSGVFVTNHHVIRGQALLVNGQLEGGIVGLVVDPGEPSQRAVKARVIGTDTRPDLAVLKVEGGGSFTPLALGRTEALSETMPVTAFGYPFGAELATRSRALPSVSVNPVHVTALRKIGDEIEELQVDGSLNPGNSGGPVLDSGGRVVGIVVSGIPGAGINQAIPVGKLVEFLDRPILSLRPPALSASELTKEKEWSFEVSRLNPSGEPPDDLSIRAEVTVSTNKGQQTRYYEARRVSPGRYVAAVTPLVRKPRARVGLVYWLEGDDVARTIGVEDRPVQIDGRDVLLSDLSWINADPKGWGSCRAALRDGRMLEGRYAGLGKVASTNPKVDWPRAADLARAYLIECAADDVPSPGRPLMVKVDVKRGDQAILSEIRHLPLDLPGVDPKPGPGPASFLKAAPRGQDLVAAGKALDAGAVPAGSRGSIRPPSDEIPEGMVVPGAGPFAVESDLARQEMRPIAIPDVAIESLAFSPDGSRLAVGAFNGFVAIYDLQTSRQERIVADGKPRSSRSLGTDSPDSILGLGFREDGRSLLAAIHQGQPVLFPPGGAPPVPFLGGASASAVDRGMFDPSGGRALLMHEDRTVRLWDVGSARLIREVATKKALGLFATDWASLLLLEDDGEFGPSLSLRSIDLETGASHWKEPVDWPNRSRVARLAILPDRGGCAIVFANGAVEVRDHRTGKVARRLETKLNMRPAGAAVSPDGKWLARTYVEGVATLWDLKRGLQVARAVLPKGGMAAFGLKTPGGNPAFSTDGRTLAIGAWGGVALWELPRATMERLAASTPDLPSEIVERKLPGKIRDVITAGGGRYLLLTLPEARTLAVFDANAGDVVGTIPLRSDNVLVAGGATKLLIAYPGENLIERRDLASRGLEASANLPIRGNVLALAMGSDTSGPALVEWSDFDPKDPNKRVRRLFSLIDPGDLTALYVPSLRERDDNFKKDWQIRDSSVQYFSSYNLAPNAFLPPIDHEIRASGDGGLFVSLLRAKGSIFLADRTCMLSVKGPEMKVLDRLNSADRLTPGPDARVVYCGADGVRDPRSGPIAFPGQWTGTRPIFLPTEDPKFLLGLRGLGMDSDPSRSDGSIKSFGVSLHAAGNPTPLATLIGLGEMESLFDAKDWWLGPHGVAPERRFHWITAANLFVTIPPSDDRLVLRRVELKKLQDQAPGIHFFVTSAPVVAYVPKAALTHQVEATCPDGSPRFSLETGPKGLTVASDGLITWDAPEIPKAFEEASILIQDEAGHSLSHAIRLEKRSSPSP